MSRYQELMERLFSLNRAKDLKTDLSGPLDIARRLGHPEKKFPSVHIVGTNGKGSVAYKMAAVLEENGYRVGLFTSPHLETYRERIQVNRKMISEKEVISGLENIFSITKNPKFFEVTTLLAFDYFAKKEVDIAFIEAGLGGRLDATNIITPMLSIITSIAIDHAPILGETLEEIAREKSGVIKPGVPVLIGKSAQFDSIIRKARPLYIAGDEPKKIARKGLKLLPFTIETMNGLEENPPCRYEKHGDVILDVAHNPSALTRLFKRVKREYPDRKIAAIFGIAKDKDLEEALKVVQSYADKTFFLPANHPRLFSFEHVIPAEKALEEGRKQGAIIVVAGSFYIMKDLLPLLASPESQEKKEYNHPSVPSQTT